MAYIEFFKGKKGVIAERLWRERSDILFRGTSGTSLIGAINANFCSSSPRIGIVICSDCIKPGRDMD